MHAVTFVKGLFGDPRGSKIRRASTRCGQIANYYWNTRGVKGRVLKNNSRITIYAKSGIALEMLCYAGKGRVLESHCGNNVNIIAYRDINTPDNCIRGGR